MKNKFSFKPIPGYEGTYFINRDGEVLSQKTSRYKIINGCIGKNGYREIGLRKDGTLKRWTVSQLMALTFLKTKTSHKEWIYFQDGNRLNNNIKNLKTRKPRSKIKFLKELVGDTVVLVSPRHNMNNTQAIRNTKGRFFGVTTKNTTFNAQLRKETPHYFTFLDRNANMLRKVAKTSIVSVNCSNK